MAVKMTYADGLVPVNNNEAHSLTNKNQSINKFMLEDDIGYISNIIPILKSQPDSSSVVEISGDKYLILEQNDTEDGSVELIGIKTPKSNNVNIVLLAYLMGENIKTTIEKVILKMVENMIVNFYIVGRGPLQQYIEAFAKSNKVEDRLYIVEHLSNPLRLLAYSDYYIPVPKIEVNTIEWNNNSAYLRGFIYIPGFIQGTPFAAKKRLVVRNEHKQMIREVNLENTPLDLLVSGPNRINDKINYEYAGFEGWIDFSERMLPNGMYLLSVVIEQYGVELEAPFNFIQKDPPGTHRIKDRSYTFIKENREIGIEVSF